MANFASYTIGSTFTADGREWTITNVATRLSKEGRSVRVFTVTDGNVTLEKSSRGLTFWINGGSGDEPTASREQAGEGMAAAVAGAVAASIGGVMQGMMEDVEERIAAAIAASTATPEGIRSLVDERIAAMTPQRVEVKQASGEWKDVGVQHTMFESLLRAVSQRLNIWLVGTAGSGKTTAAFNLAAALGLKAYAKSIGPQTTESSLLGYMDATGRYVRTQLRDAYEHGGVFLLDEVDSAPAGIIIANNVLANTQAAFPDTVVKRHPDFCPIAGANTIGQGADRRYVGRQQIDAATLDRFVFMPWDSDPRLEAAACGVPLSAFAGLPMLTPRQFHGEDGVADRCVEFVRTTTRIRIALAKLGDGVRMIVGNRSNIHGTALVRAGWTVADALEATVWRGCDRDTRNKVESNC